MGMEDEVKEKSKEEGTCYRGCCRSTSIPLHLPPTSFSLLSPIARGSESTVYEARLGGGERVAAKKPVLSTSDDLDKFHYQLSLLCALGDHPGLAKLVAAHARPPNYMFFFEFYDSPNLADRIHLHDWTPSVHALLSIALHLARALRHLHDLGIVHRDIKPANILLDEGSLPRLADFGLAMYKKDLKHVTLENWKSSGKPTGGFHKKNMVGTLIYMAPEILRKDIHTEKSDVYSFAITINELLTGVVPYTDVRAEAQAHTVLEMTYTEQKLTAAVASDGLRPVLAGSDSSIPAALLALIQRCWDPTPSSRPSFEAIVHELTTLEETINHGSLFTSSLNNGSGSNVALNYPLCQENICWSDRGAKTAKGLTADMFAPKLQAQSFESISEYYPTLSSGSFATCGRRETMEDTHFLLPQLCYNDDFYAFGIFDGHRGAAAAEFSVQFFPVFLQRAVQSVSPTDALIEAFVQTDAAFRDELAHQRYARRIIQKDWHPGCTALSALIVRDKLFVANAGDCRAVLCRNGQPFPMSKDHVASRVDERDRVRSEGLEVKWQMDTWRVGPAALQVTRSIGDDDLKPAVTAKPEIIQTSLSAHDEYLVMASDGLWDVLDAAKVLSIIKDTVKEPGMCSKRLATEAIERGSKDNITVIVVFLHPVSTAERIF